MVHIPNAYRARTNQPYAIGSWYAWGDKTGIATGESAYGILYSRSSRLFSMSHKRSPNGYLAGGPFWVQKVEERLIPSNGVTVYRPSYAKVYSGALILNSQQWFIPSAWLGSNSVRDSHISANQNKGAQAWAGMKPAKPSFNGLQELLELKDVPNTIRSAVRDFRKNRAYRAALAKRRNAGGRSALSRSGEYYVAIQFGWLPIVRSANKFRKEFSQRDTKFRKLLSNENKWKRRRFDFPPSPPTVTRGTINYNNGYGAGCQPTFVTQCYGGTSTRDWVRTQSTRSWSTGFFKYVLPPGPRDAIWAKKLMGRMFGSRLTPSVLWELMPWSWFSDYFADVGQFAQAISGGVEDRMTARMCFVMTHFEDRVETTGRVMVQNSKSGGSLSTATARSVAAMVFKARAVASPFGFGFKSSDLTLTQGAILGALGLSKLP